MQILTFLLAGIASWYSIPGGTMANGHHFNPSAHICAMQPPFSLGTKLELTNADNGASSWCIVEDRGPWIAGRVLDVSPAVRDELQMGGLANVLVYQVVGHLPNCTLRPRPQTCKAPPPHLCVLDLPKPALLRCP